MPQWLRGEPARPQAARRVTRRTTTARHRGFMRRLPRPSILDRYVAVDVHACVRLCALGLLALFYISTFIDLSDKVFKGAGDVGHDGAYLWYMPPQYIYYVLPMAVLLAALVTIGVLTKNSELIVMKACGISLYRMAVPMLGGALLAAARSSCSSRPRSDRRIGRPRRSRNVMNGVSPQTLDMLNRQWVVGSRGEIYHYNYFDPKNNSLMGISIYEFSDGMRSLVQPLVRRARALRRHARSSDTVAR